MRVCVGSATPGRTGTSAARIPRTSRLVPGRWKPKLRTLPQGEIFPALGAPAPHPGNQDSGKDGEALGSWVCTDPDSGGLPPFLSNPNSNENIRGCAGTGRFLQRALFEPRPHSAPFTSALCSDLRRGGGGGRKLHKITPCPLTTESLIFSLPQNGKEYISLHRGFFPTGWRPNYQFPTYLALFLSGKSLQTKTPQMQTSPKAPLIK